MNVPAGADRALMQKFLAAFEAFKQANDQRLAALEAKRGDVLLDEKLARLDHAVSRQQASLEALRAGQARPPLSQPRAEETKARREFTAFLRTGLESKAVQSSPLGDGGHLVSSQVESRINTAIKDTSVFRQIASVRTASAGQHRILTSAGGDTAGWVGETDARPETISPKVEGEALTFFDLYAMPAATQTMLDDAAIDIEAWLVDEVRATFGEMENDAFINGNGTSQPLGLLNRAIAAEGTQDPDEIGYIATGVDGDFSAAAPMDDLLDLIYAPRPGYRANGSFLMNRRTVSAVRKLKDTEGQYLWRPSQSAGEPASLLGYPVHEIETMPDIGSDAYAVAFGDFARALTVVDRKGVSVLRDPYSNKPYVLFYMVKRVALALQDARALKLLKFGVN